jgi:hypothetical protein
MSRSLSVYSDRTLLAPHASHVPMLSPFWGRETRRLSAPEYTDEYIARGDEFLRLTTLAEADIAVYPEDIRSLVVAEKGVQRLTESGRERLESFASAATAAGARPVFFLRTDYVQPLGLDGARVFRTALHRAMRSPDEFALPGFHEDLLAYVGGRMIERRKPARPTVGFCGGVVRERRADSLRQKAALAAGRAKWASLAVLGRPDERDLYARSEALDALHAQDSVDTSIVVRDVPGWGGSPAEQDPKLWDRVRREYVDISINSDYALCVRGVGNWSYRFSEVLSLGRIPVLVDTHGVLPYDFLVKWSDHMVVVDRKDVGQIGERVAAFHEGLTDADFVELQHACRRLWEEYLSPLGYFKNFHHHFTGAQRGAEAS